MSDEVVQDHRPDIYLEGDQYIFRASTFGGCTQALIRSGLGHTPAPFPDHLRTAMDYGTENEARVLQELSSRWGWKMLDKYDLKNQFTGKAKIDKTGQAAFELKVPGGLVRCHPDAIVQCYSKETTATTHEIGDRRVAEVKILAEGSRPFENPRYTWQFAIEMAATKLPGLYVVAWKKDGEIIVKDNGDLKMSVAYYNEPPHTLGQIKARAALIARGLRQAEEGGELPECQKMWPCGFYQDAPCGEKAEVERLDDDEVERWLIEWAEMKSLADRAKKRMDEAKAMIAKLTALDPNAKVGVLGFEVKRVVQETWTWDKAAMEQDGVLEKYRKPGAGKDYIEIKETR